MSKEDNVLKMDIENEKNTEYKIKNLTITELKKHSKKLDEQEEHEIYVNNEPYRFKVDISFRKSKQHKLLDDLIDFFNEGNDDPNLLDMATPYTSLLLIKHFTSVHVPDDIESALEVLEVLIDLELITEILNLMPEDEVFKVYELLSTTVDRMRENIADANEETLALAEKVDNPVLKEMLLNESKQSE